MLNEIRGRDLLRTVILGAFGLGFFSLCFYMRGGLSATVFEALLAFIVAGGVFDTFWLNAKRTRLRSKPGRLIPRAEKQERQIATGRKITRWVGAVVIASLTIYFVIKLGVVLHLRQLSGR